MVEFCTKINQMIPTNVKETFYPIVDKRVSLFEDDGAPVVIDPSKLVRKNVKKQVLDTQDAIDEKYWKSQWQDMPEFTQEANEAYRTVTMKFRSREDYDEFSQKIGQEVTDKTKSIWHPKLNVTKNLELRWVQESKHLIILIFVSM